MVFDDDVEGVVGRECGYLEFYEFGEVVLFF